LSGSVQIRTSLFYSGDLHTFSLLAFPTTQPPSRNPLSRIHYSIDYFSRENAMLPPFLASFPKSITCHCNIPVYKLKRAVNWLQLVEAQSDSCIADDHYCFLVKTSFISIEYCQVVSTAFSTSFSRTHLTPFHETPNLNLDLAERSFPSKKRRISRSVVDEKTSVA
jgi:hypothetical protein